MKYIFIVNPIAGNDNKKEIFKKLKAAFAESEHEMIIEKTHFGGEAKTIAAEYAAKDDGEYVVVACGGDGTVHEVANGLAGSGTPMMLLPLGTGNDFAKKVYNTKKADAEAIIEALGLYSGNPVYQVKPIDLIDYNGEKCINVMSFGLDTVVETIGKKLAAKAPFLGHQAYNLAIVPVLAKPLHYTISYDISCVDKETGASFQMQENNKDYALFAVCNASYYGGGFCPAPQSKLDDGLLDYALIDGLALHQALPMLPKYANGTASEETCGEKFHTGLIREGRIWNEDGSPLLGNCDGENFDYSEIIFKVEENALQFCFLKETE